MAFGTFEPDAEEELADDRRDLFGLATVAEERGRPLRRSAPSGRDDRAHEPIVGQVAAERVANPGVEIHVGLDAHPIRIRASRSTHLFAQ